MTFVLISTQIPLKDFTRCCPTIDTTYENRSFTSTFDVLTENPHRMIENSMCSPNDQLLKEDSHHSEDSLNSSFQQPVVPDTTNKNTT